MAVTASLANKLEQKECSRAAAGLTSFRSVYSHIVYKNGELKLCDFCVKNTEGLPSGYYGANIHSTQLFQCPVLQSVLPYVSFQKEACWLFESSLDFGEIMGFVRTTCYFDLKLAWSVTDIFSKGECPCKLKPVLFFYIVLEENVMPKRIVWSCVLLSFHRTKIAGYAGCLRDLIDIRMRKQAIFIRGKKCS